MTLDAHDKAMIRLAKQKRRKAELRNGYFAAVLDHETWIKLTALAIHPNVHCHHVTMAFNPDDAAYAKYAALIGNQIEFDIIAAFWNEKAQAAIVSGVPSENANPHVTISCADGVKPFYSNEMLGGDCNASGIVLALRGRAAVKWFQH